MPVGPPRYRGPPRGTWFLVGFVFPTHFKLGGSHEQKTMVSSRRWLADRRERAVALTATFGQKPETRTSLMRQKLELSGRILEGLTREDFPQIIKSAKALRAVSEAADFAEPKLGRRMYRFFSLEFQEMTDEIVSTASKKNLDRATIAYLQLVINCVRCHKDARDPIK